MKIYIAGPMRGIAHFNRQAFDDASQKFRDAGHEVFNPVDLDLEMWGETYFEENPEGDPAKATEKFGMSPRVMFKADLSWICDHAEMIVLLPGWKDSLGAVAEAAAGHAIGIDVVEYENVTFEAI